MSADSARTRCVRRAIVVARLLAAEELTLKQLAQRLDCGHRTARRYVNALRLAGVDVESTDDRPAKSYRLDRRAWSCVLDLPAD